MQDRIVFLRSMTDLDDLCRCSSLLYLNARTTDLGDQHTGFPDEKLQNGRFDRDTSAVISHFDQSDFEPYPLSIGQQRSVATESLSLRRG